MTSLQRFQRQLPGLPPIGTVVVMLGHTSKTETADAERRPAVQRLQDRTPDMNQDIRPTRYDGVRVLVAEDSSINRRLSRLLLEMLGCRITCVTSGFQAVEAFRESEYDLVLMDCNMPGMDGFEATEMIRNLEHAKGSRRHVPIVAVTAFALPSDRNYCIRRGMDDCLIKPLRKDMLIDVLGRWLNIRSLSA